MAIADKFLELDAKRTGVLERARECARLTIPSVLPPSGYTESDTLPTPYQSVGARGVNQLTSKLLLVLMPANVPFFKLDLAPAVARAIGIENSRLQELFSLIERRIMTKLEEMNVRKALATAIRDLIVTGNSLIQFGKETIKVHKLSNYVVERDAAGNVKRLIVREGLSWEGLPEELKQILQRKEDFTIQNPEEYFKQQGVTLWTMAEWGGSKWVVTQEVDKYPVKQVTYTKENFPFIVLRWSQVPGENYGRGLIEQYLGDLKTLEALYEALVTGALQASRVIWLVSPTSALRPKDIQDAWNGDVLVGNANDVTAVQLQKYADFQWVQVQAAALEQRLAQTFFLVPSAIRNAERVTAEEIRLVSQELEIALGGVYTLLTTELQKPLLRFILNRLKTEGEIKDLDKFEDVLEIKIITGFAGLGRNEDFNRLVMYLQAITGVPGAAEYLKVNEILTQMAVSLGVDPGIVKTEEEKQMEMLQQQSMAVALQQAIMQQQQQAAGGGGGAVPQPSPAV